MKKSEKKTNQKVITDFLLRSAPKELVDGLSVLSKLKIPVHDKQAFEQQLSELAGQTAGNLSSATSNIVRRFNSNDFPILSLENAFEKFRDRLYPVPWNPFPIPRWPVPQPVWPGPVRPAEPSACDVYEETFGRGTLAANCACRNYADAIRQGLGHLNAVLIGHFAGIRAERTGVCDG